jgi:hypothetical protein
MHHSGNIPVLVNMANNLSLVKTMALLAILVLDNWDRNIVDESGLVNICEDVRSLPESPLGAQNAIPGTLKGGWLVPKFQADIKDPMDFIASLSGDNDLSPLYGRIKHGGMGGVETPNKGIDELYVLIIRQIQLGTRSDAFGTADEENDAIRICVQGLDGNAIGTRL